jgi:Tol biopolymer transport system component
LKLVAPLLAGVLICGSAFGAPSRAREILFIGLHKDRDALLVIRADGTGMRVLVSEADGGYVGSPGVWSPDGSRVLVADHDGLVSLPAEGGEPARLTTGADSPVGWSPDGRWLAFIRYGTKAGLFVAPADGREPRLLRAPVFGAVWAPDSKRLVYGLRNHLETVDLSGHWHVVPHSECGRDPAFSPDGKWFAMARCLGHDEGIAVERADGTGYRWLVHPNVPTASWGPMWAPDSRRIAYTLETTNCDYEHTEIRLISLDGRRRGNLDSDCSAHDEYPRWSPDGTQIVFDRDAAVEPIGEADELAVADSRTGAVRLLRQNSRGTQSWRPG